MSDYRFPSAPAWRFRTKRFLVALEVSRIRGYRYDGDDEDRETQEKIDSGEWHAFESSVVVYLDGKEIGRDSLYGNVYANPPEFWQAHRGPDPMDRNCSVMRAANGDNVCICHYFPDMVRSAIACAREYVRDLKPVPCIRESAS